MKQTKLQKAGLFFSGLMTVWFVIPMVFSGIVNIGNVTGLVLFVSVFLIIFRYEKVKSGLKRINMKKTGRVLTAFVSVIFCGVVLLALFETVLMVAAAAADPEPSATVIVLGCKVSGEKPSKMMEERLKVAQKYLEENPESKCILSGGQGDDEEISEAECMYRYLVNNGISPERLYKEDKSTSTRENLVFSQEIIEREGLNPDVAIATNEFHGYRAKRVAQSLGLNSGALSAITTVWVVPTYYMRELYGILYEWIM